MRTHTGAEIRRPRPDNTRSTTRFRVSPQAIGRLARPPCSHSCDVAELGRRPLKIARIAPGTRLSSEPAWTRRVTLAPCERPGTQARNPATSRHRQSVHPIPSDRGDALDANQQRLWVGYPVSGYAGPGSTVSRRPRYARDDAEMPDLSFPLDKYSKAKETSTPAKSASTAETMRFTRSLGLKARFAGTAISRTWTAGRSLAAAILACSSC